MTTDPTPSVIEALHAGSTHHDVDLMLRAAGWTPCGAGDWAYALASPDVDLVARISPFDPVGPYTARLYTDAAATGQVPRLLTHRALVGGGDLQVMERLLPVPEAEAVDALARFARPEPDLADLAVVVARVHAEALRDLPWCGPLDTNPSNIMRTLEGNLVLTDPYYADGPNLYAAAEGEPDRFVTTIPAEQRRFLTEIPLAASGPWAPEDRAALRETLRRSDAQRSRSRVVPS
jgi:hypothetical protein